MSEVPRPEERRGFLDGAGESSRPVPRTIRPTKIGGAQRRSAHMTTPNAGSSVLPRERVGGIDGDTKKHGRMNPIPPRHGAARGLFDSE